MTQTTTDEHDGTYLVLRVAAAEDDGAEPDTRWSAHVCDPASPLAGLYAFGPSLAAVRDAVAVLAWSAVMAGELASFGLTAESLAGIHLILTTNTGYDAAALAAAVPNHAA
jgi:hypothetical protein